MFSKRRKDHFIFLFLISMLFIKSATAQIYNTEFSFHFGFNITLNYQVGGGVAKGNFPGIRAYVGFNSSNLLGKKKNDGSNGHKQWGLLNYSSSLVIYNKSLGNSMNLDFQDNQIDWTSSATFGFNWGEETVTRHLQSINNSPFYNIRHNHKYAALMSMNFIMNNHLRNQSNGAISFTRDNVSINYYNDGGPLLNLGFGDQFDRFWTGGGAIYIHDEYGGDENIRGEGFNRIEVGFDQFTGYAPQMFELAGVFGIDIQDYEIYHRFGKTDSLKTYSLNVVERRRENINLGYDYNASTYQVKYYASPGLGVQAGVIGSLRDNKNERYYAVQDIIHLLKGDPIHPNKGANRIFVGLLYDKKL